MKKKRPPFFSKTKKNSRTKMARLSVFSVDFQQLSSKISIVLVKRGASSAVREAFRFEQNRGRRAAASRQIRLGFDPPKTIRFQSNWKRPRRVHPRFATKPHSDFLRKTGAASFQKTGSAGNSATRRRLVRLKSKPFRLRFQLKNCLANRRQTAKRNLRYLPRKRFQNWPKNQFAKAQIGLLCNERLARRR